MQTARRLDLTGALSGVWLLDPTKAKPYVYRALTIPCPSPLTVARERKRRLEFARGAAGRAVKGPGVTEGGERRLAAGGGQIVATAGRVGTIPVYGPIGQRLTAEVLKCGGTSCEEISAALDALLADKTVEAIVLDVDSPGGSSYGVEELSDKIYESRAQKPIYAIANSMACSAAYWIASAAGQVLATVGGDVGSVGCYVMHCDQSGHDEQMGLRVTFVSAGKYKVEANPHEPLSDEAAAYLQEQVDYTAGRFVEALARNRGVSPAEVAERFGQGRVLNAEGALAAGMVDRVLSFDDLLRKLTGGGPEGGPMQSRRTGKVSAQADAEQQMRRLRHEHEKRKQAILSGWTADEEPPAKPPEQEPGKEEGADDRPMMEHTSEVNPDEPPFEDVDQDKLPDHAFADPDERKYAHHYVEDGGDEDEDGRYTSGKMYLHSEGLDIAHAQAGEDGDEEALAHLEEHQDDVEAEDEEPKKEPVDEDGDE